MATLSSYPIDRNRGHKGYVVLRLPADDMKKVIEDKGPDFITANQFILRGSIKPFKAELRADANGNKIMHHGKGRMQLSVRIEDLTPLTLGDDLVVENLTLRVEPDGIWLMETTDTTFRKTRRHKSKKGLPAVVPQSAAPAAEPAEPEAEEHKTEVALLHERVAELENRVLAFEELMANDPQPQKGQSLIGDLLTLKKLCNQILAEHHAALIAVTIGNGKIDSIQVRPLDITV